MTPRVDTQAAVSDEYSAAVTGEPIKYRAGFHDVVANWNHSPFHEFIDDLHGLGAAAAIEADKKRRGRA
jgi:hypothetical protein